MKKSDREIWEIHEENLINCTKCTRLVQWREKVSREKRRAFHDQEYWGKPVLGFGDYDAALVIVGLAPGAHGSNRTGRMFTGDASGDFLYSGLFKYGFANQPSSFSRSDGLKLKSTYITSVCHCAPPANKPVRDEIINCLQYLQLELTMLKNKKVLVCLGHLAFNVINALYPDDKPKRIFSHGAQYSLNDNNLILLCSYHPSRQNTQTGRLTVAMGDRIWSRVDEIINE